MNISNDGLRYYLYARKSSETEDRQVQSIDDQHRWLKKKASLLGIKVVDTYQESKSAKMPGNRPVFAEMIAKITAGEADGLLVWDISRASRNPVDSATIQWLLQQGKLKSLITNTREYKPEDNTLVFSVESGMANQYIIELRRNTRRGIQSKLEKGWKPGLAPIGYINDKVNDKGNKEVLVDEERFYKVRKIWDYMLTGNYNPRQVLQLATDEWKLTNKPSRKAERAGMKHGVPLSLSGVYRLLSNPFYAGIIQYDGKEYGGKHTPMISLSEFQRVQEILGAKGRPQPKTREFSFTGNIRCGECGCLITAETKTKFVKMTAQYKDYTYYRCTRKKARLSCKQKPIRLEDLEPQMDVILNRFRILPVFKDWALEILKNANDIEIVDRSKLQESIATQLVDMQRQLDNLTQMRYRELIDDEEFVKERKALQSKLLMLRCERDDVDTRANDWMELTEQTFNFACYARRAFMSGDVRTKREIFAALGKNATLTDGKLELEINDWFKPIAEKYENIEKEYEKVRTEQKSETTPVKKEKMAAFATTSSSWGE